MEIKGKTILSIRGSKGKEFLTISISSKGKDGKYYVRASLFRFITRVS